MRAIAGGVDVPVNADFEGGFAVEPAKVAVNVTAATATGVAGLSIEDSTGRRSEGFIVGRPDLAETIRRLRAYAEAGADCLYAPGIRTRAEIAAVVEAAAPKPVNVLVGSDFTTVAELAVAGVRRISVGGALARAAWTGFLQAANEIADLGTFKGLVGAVPFDEINESFDVE